MFNLNNFLLKKDSIIELVKIFGFLEKSKIYCDENNIPRLIVFANPKQEISYKNQYWLQAKIVELLGSNVKVNVFESFDKLYHHHVENNSAEFNDIEKLKNIFKEDNLDTIIFPSLDETEFALHTNILQEANKYLETCLVKKSSVEVETNKARVNSPKRHMMFSPSNTQSSTKKARLEMHATELVITIPLPNGVKESSINTDFLIEKIIKDFFESIKSVEPQQEEVTFTAGP